MEGKYTFVVKEDDDNVSVCITDGGKYHGVVYKYGVVSVPEKENADGTLPFRFEYDIVDNYDVPKEEFNDEFFNLIGDILVHIIENQEEGVNERELNEKNT